MADLKRLEFARSRLHLKEDIIYPIGCNCWIDPLAEFGEGKLVTGHNVVIIGRVYFQGTCVIGSNATIGDAGFGFALDENRRPVEIIHTGGVRIGDNVRIGSNAVVSRGTVNDTVIDDNVKIDHLVHIAHNVVVGANSLVVSGVTICGSAVLGNNCWIGANSVVKNKVMLAEGTYVGIGSSVVKDIADPYQVWAGSPARYIRDRMEDE